MKNISRRVFIKGLAVAGVAAAASTVLAGCNTNMIPDVDNGTDGDTNEDTTTGNVQTVTFTDQVTGKKLTMDITNVAYQPVGKLMVLSVKVTNNLGKTVKLANASAAAAAGTEYVVYPAVDSIKTANNVAVSGTPAVSDDAATATSVSNLFATAGTTLSDGDSCVGVMILEDVSEDWAKAALSLKVNKHDGTNAITGYDVVKFNLTNK